MVREYLGKKLTIEEKTPIIQWIGENFLNIRNRELFPVSAHQPNIKDNLSQTFEGVATSRIHLKEFANEAKSFWILYHLVIDNIIQMSLSVPLPLLRLVALFVVILASHSPRDYPRSTYSVQKRC